jgi:hypothetical protein
MKKVLALLVFVVLLFNSSVFAQKTRIVKVQPVIVPAAPVVYSQTQAFTDGRGVYLEWQTASEKNNLGFYIYRQSGKGREMVGSGIIPGGYLHATDEQASGDKYTYFDPNGDANTIYFVESYSIDGQKVLSNPIITQYTSDLKIVAGKSSAELIQAKQITDSNTIKSNLTLPKDLQSEINENRGAPNLAEQRRIAALPGVKIGVRKDGLVRVTKTELQNAGFDVNASTNLWQLWVNGVEQAITVEASGNFVEFYGEALDTVETGTQIYYLVVGAENGKRIQTRLQRPIAGSVLSNSFAQVSVQKQRKIYLPNYLNGDDENYVDNIPVTPSGRTLTFNLPSIDFNVRKAEFTIGIIATTPIDHHFRVVLNGEELDGIFGEGDILLGRSFGIPSAYLREGTNTLQMFGVNGSSDIGFIESIKASYSRLYEAQNNQLAFYTANYRQSNLQGFTSPNVRVYDLTYPDEPMLVTDLTVSQSGSNYTVRLPANRGRVMYAVEDSAVAPAATIVPNNPSMLATPTNAQYIVVTHKDFINEANTWANFRQAQGLTTRVVEIEDIYDEFNFGKFGTAGIRSFLQYAKNNWQTQYVLFLGDAYYDFRNYEGTGYNNWIPTKMVDTVYGETGSDEALADFDDDGLAEIAVGRIPARTGAVVTQALNKTMAYESLDNQWMTRGALFVSDEPIGFDFAALSQRLREQLPANMPATMIQRNQPTYEESRAQMLASMNSGKHIVNYSGHGSTGFWAVSNPPFFVYTDALALTNTPNYSFFTMLTCLNGYFLGGNDSLAESLMKSNGGAAASWTSTGKTTPDVQEVMATQFFQQVTAGTMPRIGDLIKDAKTAVIGGRDVRLSWVLIGDPALKLR